MTKLTGQRVLELRTQRGLSQQELGERIGMSRSWVAAVELNSQHRPDGDAVERLAAELGTTADELRKPLPWWRRLFRR